MIPVGSSIDSSLAVTRWTIVVMIISIRIPDTRCLISTCKIPANLPYDAVNFIMLVSSGGNRETRADRLRAHSAHRQPSLGSVARTTGSLIQRASGYRHQRTGDLVWISPPSGYLENNAYGSGRHRFKAPTMALSQFSFEMV